MKIHKGTSKNPTRHAELVSASPLYQGIADHVRNDDCAKSVVFRSPHNIDLSFLTPRPTGLTCDNLNYTLFVLQLQNYGFCCK